MLFPYSVIFRHPDLKPQHMQQFLAKNPDFQMTIMVMLPIFHMYGQAMLIFGLIRGYKIITLPRFIPDKFLGAIEKYRVSLDCFCRSC